MQLWGLKNVKKKGYIEQTCESKNKTNKNFGILGNGFTHARTGLRTHNQAYMRRLDHAYADPCPVNLKM